LAEAPAPAAQSSKWLNFIDRPSTADVALPAVLMSGLGALVYFYPEPSVLQVAMAIATGSTLFFVYRKERKLGRSVLLGVGGLVLGFVLGGILYPLIEPHVFNMPLNEVFISLVTFFILWVFSSFTK
jgi:hypothetical protein